MLYYILLYVFVLLILFILYWKGIFFALIIGFLKEEEFRIFIIISIVCLYILAYLVQVETQLDYYGSMLSIRGIRRMSSLTGYSDYVVLNPQMDLGFKDIENGGVKYVVAQTLSNKKVDPFSQEGQSFYKFFKAGKWCFSFLQSFEFIGSEERLHPMLVKLYVNSYDEWVADVRFFTTKDNVPGCEYNSITHITQNLSINGKENLNQNIRNVGIRFKLNKELSLIENIYQITGARINFLNITAYDNKFVIKFPEYKSFGEYIIKVLEPKLAKEQILVVLEIDNKFYFKIENSGLGTSEFNCCKYNFKTGKTDSPYMQHGWQSKFIKK